MSLILTQKHTHFLQNMLGTSCSLWTCRFWIPGSPSCHATSQSDDGFEDRSHAITALDDADDFTPSCRFAQDQQLGREKNKKTSEDEDGSSIEHGSLLGGFICFHLLINLFIYSIIFYLFIYFFISIYSILFLPLNMDAMITEFECNSFRSVNQNCQAKHH